MNNACSEWYCELIHTGMLHCCNFEKLSTAIFSGLKMNIY